MHTLLTNNAQKYGRPNEQTPAAWNSGYIDYNASAAPGTFSAPTAQTTSKADVLNAPAVDPTTGDVDMADDKTLINGDASGEADSKKRKSKHEGETPEERAERKKRKKEKKEAKA
jgi:H/ACA ribonucleoprotein complex subunit 4